MRIGSGKERKEAVNARSRRDRGEKGQAEAEAEAEAELRRGAGRQAGRQAARKSQLS